MTLSGLDIISGILEVCVDGAYYRVCANSTHANLDSLAGILACNSMGYDCKCYALSCV